MFAVGSMMPSCSFLGQQQMRPQGHDKALLQYIAETFDGQSVAFGDLHEWVHACPVTGWQ